MIESAVASVFAIFKAFGAAIAGMVGAAVLYLVLPPLNTDGTWSKKEFAFRLAIAGVFSDQFGPWVVTMLCENFPRIHADAHQGAIWMIVGAPGWWVSRLVALYMQNRSDKDPLDIIDEIRNRKS